MTANTLAGTKGGKMNWTKIPTNLIVEHTPDKDMLAIVKYQLLWAVLEHRPDDRTALRHMSANQLRIACQYIDSISGNISLDINSCNNHRSRQKLYYAKIRSVEQKTDGHTDGHADGHNDTHTDGHADGIDKIREENNKENIYKRKFTVDSIITVNGQDFNQFPPESMPLLKKHWTDDKIEYIRKDLAAMYPHETTVAILLTKYESNKQTKKKFAPPTLDEWLEYSAEKGLKLKKMEEAYEAYEVAGWHDSQGKPILNWKQKILNVWCKDENRESFPMKQKML